MRKLIYGINITLDGCIDHTKGVPDDEVHQYFTDLIKDAGLLVYGRKTYELMVPFWPDMAGNPPADAPPAIVEFAQTFDAVEKLVFSRTLSSLEDKHSTLATTNLHDEIVRLKQQEGKYIMAGGVDLPAQLIQLGLVDEFHFVVQPIIVGVGRRLFDHTNFAETLQLKLAGSKTFRSGCVAMRYVK